MKKFLFVILLLFLVTTTHHYTKAYAGKKKYAPQPDSIQPNCTIGAFSGNAYFNAGVANGDAVGYATFSCVGMAFTPCVGLIGCQLWYDSPAGWVLVDTQCENVTISCGSNQTFTLTIGDLNFYTAGDYYFQLDAMTGSCSAVGTLISRWSTYFTN